MLMYRDGPIGLLITNRVYYLLCWVVIFMQTPLVHNVYKMNK